MLAIVITVIVWALMFVIGNFVARGMVNRLCDDDEQWGFWEYLRFQVFNALSFGVWGMYVGYTERHNNPCTRSRTPPPMMQGQP